MAIVVLVPLHNFQECAHVDLFDNKQLSLKSKLLKLVLLKKKKVIGVSGLMFFAHKN